MTRFSLIALTTVVLLTATGCSSTNRIVGHQLTQVGHWYGELGITGHGNNLTVQSGSRLTKLSIIGDGNTVTVRERCSLGKIELWGDNNTVNIPEYLVVRIAQVGPGNKIIRIPAGMTIPAEPTQPPVMEELIEQPTMDETAVETAEPDPDSENETE